jgi:outer membrane translocation and assembly module TamA
MFLNENNNNNKKNGRNATIPIYASAQAFNSKKRLRRKKEETTTKKTKQKHRIHAKRGSTVLFPTLKTHTHTQKKKTGASTAQPE